MIRGETILDALAGRGRLPQRTIVVAAHPDDETIGLGAQLCRFDNLTVVHVTDGAPRDGRDAANYGFASVPAYGNARRRELAEALTAGEVCARTLSLGIADQEACRDLTGLSRRIADLFAVERPKAVITHAYEGGHPDHDAAAFAVHAGCRLIEDPPTMIEMALYNRQDGQRVSGRFLGGPEPVTLMLDDRELKRKQRMIDRFATQRWLLVQLDFTTERVRVAPAYDFGQPPHTGTLHYETLGWDITGEHWHRFAAAALAELRLDKLPCL